MTIAITLSISIRVLLWLTVIYYNVIDPSLVLNAAASVLSSSNNFD